MHAAACLAVAMCIVVHRVVKYPRRCVHRVSTVPADAGHQPAAGGRAERPRRQVLQGRRLGRLRDCGRQAYYRPGANIFTAAVQCTVLCCSCSAIMSAKLRRRPQGVWALALSDVCMRVTTVFCAAQNPMSSEAVAEKVIAALKG